MKQHQMLSQEELGKVLAELKLKAAVDADFRQQFVADPKAVIGEITGKQLNSGAVVDVVESRPEVLATYVVPVLHTEAQPQAPLVLSDQSEWTMEDYTATVEYVLNRAGMDACFRNDFLANPVATVEKQAGKKIAEEFRFDVREARPGAALTFVLPKFVGENGLTDAELMLMNAGSKTKTQSVIGIVAGTAMAIGGVVTGQPWLVVSGAVLLVMSP